MQLRTESERTDHFKRELRSVWKEAGDSMSLLEMERLSIAFSEGEKEALKDCSFVLKEREILGIVGESGSGKSTMVMSVLGFLKKGALITQGRILYQGEDITRPSAHDGSRMLRGGEIAVVMQNAMSCLDPTMKIGPQIIESVRKHTECTRQEAREKAAELLDMVGIRDVKACMIKYPFECSGGMQQRICIAIALAGNPRILIADEPTTALDVSVQAQILNLLRRIRKDMGISVILVSHDLGVVASLCDRLLVMREGRIVEEGETNEVFHNSRDEYTRTLIRARRNLEGGDSAKGRGDETEDVILKAEEISIAFHKKKALREISLSIGRGQVYGLAGESGCGKSTLARILAGIYRPDTGRIWWKGEEDNSTRKKRRAARKQKIQMVFQNPYQSLNPAMTIQENLREALRAAGVTRTSEVKERIDGILDEMNILKERQLDYPKQLSGGQLQRIAIARALLLKPELLICDEPFSGLDMYVQEQLLSLLRHIREKEGFSMLLIGHDLSVLKSVSNVLGILYAGELLEEGTVNEISEEPWHPYTKTLFLAADKVKLSKKRDHRPVILDDPYAALENAGCPYAANCKYSKKKCIEKKPDLYIYGRRKVRCFLYEEDANLIRDDQYRMSTQI